MVKIEALINAPVMFKDGLFFCGPPAMRVAVDGLQLDCRG